MRWWAARTCGHLDIILLGRIWLALAYIIFQGRRDFREHDAYNSNFRPSILLSVFLNYFVSFEGEKYRLRTRMPYSHHSHSGQFCGHAKNTLEEVIQAAIAKGFHTFALTEHIPRPYEDFYPEEIESHTEESLAKLFDDFIVEARRLRDVYSTQIQIPIGFESEYIRPSTLGLVQGILDKHSFDFFMGSVHHTHTIPIDFDRAMYEQAREKAGGTDEKLFEDYFESQYEMLQALQPPVVGHFDLIRLLSDHRDAGFEGMYGVWAKIKRNLECIASYGGLLEINASGLRKGLAEPYPCKSICQVCHTASSTIVITTNILCRCS
jgi:histidinol-phosphatase (PHP family)